MSGLEDDRRDDRYRRDDDYEEEDGGWGPLIGLFVFAMFLWFFVMPWMWAPVTPAPIILTNYPNVPVAPTGTPGSGTGTGVGAGGTPGSGTGTGVGAGGVAGSGGAGGVAGSGGAGGVAGSGGAVFTPPGDEPASNPTADSTPTGDGASAGGSTSTPPPTPVSQIKMARVFKETNYGGDDKPLLPGMKTTMATVSGGKYVFSWKSMRIEPGTKIMFSRYTGGGNTRHSFAVGQFNVEDLEDWVRSYDRISGKGNWGYGSLTIDRLDTYQSNPIEMWILNDDEWIKAIEKEQAGCVRLMRAWGGAGKGYPDSACDSVNKNTYGGVYTISM